jgi:hypothetical protein
MTESGQVIRESMVAVVSTLMDVDVNPNGPESFQAIAPIATVPTAVTGIRRSAWKGGAQVNVVGPSDTAIRTRDVPEGALTTTRTVAPGA